MRDIHIHAGHTCSIYIAQCKIYSERCMPCMYAAHVCRACMSRMYAAHCAPMGAILLASARHTFGNRASFGKRALRAICAAHAR